MNKIEQFSEEFSDNSRARSPDTFFMTNVMEQIFAQSVLPIVNADILFTSLNESKRSHSPLSCIAVGCQDWIKPAWGDHERDRIIGRIEERNKRAQRFAREITDFQKMLLSFGINTQIHFALSNIEARIHIELGHMGLKIHNSDAIEVMRESQETVVQLVTKQGGSIKPFDHTAIIKSVLETESLDTIREHIAGTSRPTMRDFLNGLYAFDLQVLPHYFADQPNISPIWLDIQSFSFEEDATAFRRAARALAPQLPIIAPFANAGDWHGAPSPERKFFDKFDIINHELNISMPTFNLGEWVKKMQHVSDEKLIKLLSSCGIDMTISNRSEQMQAISIIANRLLGLPIDRELI